VPFGHSSHDASRPRFDLSPTTLASLARLTSSSVVKATSSEQSTDRRIPQWTGAAVSTLSGSTAASGPKSPRAAAWTMRGMSFDHSVVKSRKKIVVLNT
jgi:hypothetical protein